MMTFEQYLEASGARLHGHRADCPCCRGRRTVSLNPAKQLYKCHRIVDGQECEFSGGLESLRKRLGEHEHLPWKEYVARQEKMGRERLEAQHHYDYNLGQRLVLGAELRSLTKLRDLAHEAGPDHPATWGALAVAYRDAPRVAQRLRLLEEEARGLRNPRLEERLRELRKRQHSPEHER